VRAIIQKKGRQEEKSHVKKGTKVTQKEVKKILTRKKKRMVWSAAYKRTEMTRNQQGRKRTTPTDNE